MSERLLLNSTSVPRLPRHAKLRFDRARDCWIINAPERVFELDAIAGEVIQLVDGTRTLAVLVDELATKYDQAPRADIERDVTAMLQNLADKGFVIA